MVNGNTNAFTQDAPRALLDLVSTYETYWRSPMLTMPDQLKRHMKSTHKHDSSTMISPVSEQFTLSFPIV